MDGKAIGTFDDELPARGVCGCTCVMCVYRWHPHCRFTQSDCAKGKTK